MRKATCSAEVLRREFPTVHEVLKIFKVSRVGLPHELLERGLHDLTSSGDEYDRGHMTVYPPETCASDHP